MKARRIARMRRRKIWKYIGKSDVVLIRAITDFTVESSVEGRAESMPAKQLKSNVDHVVKKPSPIWKTGLASNHAHPAGAAGQVGAGKCHIKSQDVSDLH